MLQNLNSPKSIEVGGELEPITFENLEKMKTSHGDLYWKKGNGKFVKILHSGDSVDYSQLEKYKKITNSLFIDEVCSDDFISTGKVILQKLIEASSERDRLKCRHQFLEFINDTYWHGKKEESILSLMIILKDTFYKISPEFQIEMEDRSLSILRRSSLYSTIVTITALSAGYTHGDFLRDVYNISFFNDFSCARNLISPKDLKHAKLSLDEFEKSNFYELKNKGLSRLISFHHEDFKGNTGNLGLIFDELSDLERISIFIEASIPSDECRFSKNDGIKFLSNIFEINDDDSFQMKKFKDDIKFNFLEFSEKEAIAS